MPTSDTQFEYINDFSRKKSFVGFTPTYFLETNNANNIGRLGVVYFKCGHWTPPDPEPEPEVVWWDETEEE